MEIYHFNCASMNPPGKRLINGTGGWFEPADIVTHCLFINTNSELILVDAGLARKDVEQSGRIGPGFRWTMCPALKPDEPAYKQIKAQGFDPGSVNDLIVTHLDIDHVGGLIDFPDARVHVLREEYERSQSPPLMETIRYRDELWSHDPKWTLHEPSSETDWYGFDAVKPLPKRCPDLHMVSLPGHSAGHTGVAIPLDDGWLFHCGDAYFDAREMDLSDPGCTPGFRLQQRLISSNNTERLRTQERLRDLKRNHSEINFFCSHSVDEFQRLKQRDELSAVESPTN
jgi:glyoxylase-like metal-dependent hydrolase (beta-lactamase superfamily II)